MGPALQEGLIVTHSIHQATLDDLDALVPLFDAYRQFYGKPSDLERGRAFLEERLALRESVIFLARPEAGAPAGFTQLFPSFSSTRAARIWILNDLFVASEARLSGIGKALLLEAARFGQLTGAARLVLSTARTNESAQKLYESLGWQRDEMFYEYSLALPAR
jgi:ribosomal protein S18 acetylase RimI-like enzyme